MSLRKESFPKERKKGKNEKSEGKNASGETLSALPPRPYSKGDWPVRLREPLLSHSFGRNSGPIQGGWRLFGASLTWRSVWGDKAKIHGRVMIQLRKTELGPPLFRRVNFRLSEGERGKKVKGGFGTSLRKHSPVIFWPFTNTTSIKWITEYRICQK